MENNENKKSKLNLDEEVKLEKRNVFAIAGYHLFSALLGFLAILSGYFYLTTKKWLMFING